MSTPPLLRAPTPRFDVNYLGRQWVLIPTVAVKFQPHMPYTWELLIVAGPLSVAIGLVRRMRA